MSEAQQGVISTGLVIFRWVLVGQLTDLGHQWFSMGAPGIRGWVVAFVVSFYIGNAVMAFVNLGLGWLIVRKGWE